MKKKMVFLLCFLVLLCTACQSQPEQELPQGNVITEKQEDSSLVKPGENIPVTRALAAKMIALTFSDIEDIYNLDEEISFADVNRDDWFYPYVNTAVYLGYMQGYEEAFLPNEPLTLGQVKVLLRSFSDTNLEININNENRPVSCRLWTELFYEATKERLDELNVQVQNVSVFATPEIGAMEPWHMATSAGVIQYEGYAVDGYVDQTIEIIKKGNELIGILSVVKNEGVFQNAYIDHIEENKINVTFETGQRQFEWLEEVLLPIGTVTISDNEIIDIAFADTKVKDVIKLTDSEKIEFESLGIFGKDENFKVYDITDGKIIERGLSALTTGSEIGDIYLLGETAVGAVITEKVSAETVRVVIGTTNFEGYVHTKVILEGNDFLIKSGENSIQAGKINLPEDEELFAGSNRIYIEPLKSGGTTLSSVERDWTGSAPVYQGVFEVEKREDGYVLVNEIALEEYLTAVVPSEMPTYYGLEAAKVQAVCARSYAYNQLLANRYHAYGANFDDSVLSQVYNNIPANETSIMAVAETKGEVLTYDSEVISATFFSTSSGSFANSSDVWANGNKFPSDYKVYLSAHSVSDLDLTQEENMRIFLKENNAGYDTWSEWSRWQVNMSGDQLSATIEKNIGTAYALNPFLVKTLQSDYTFKSRDVASLGKIKNIEVIRRGEGGVIMSLKIEGENSTILLRTEYIIRSVLKPVTYDGSGIEILLKNGQKVSNYSLMPSGFFIFDMEKDEDGFITAIQFSGGGLGHGVGMSQNGVKQMAEDGFDYRQILKYYYKDIVISQI